MSGRPFGGDTEVAFAGQGSILASAGLELELCELLPFWTQTIRILSTNRPHSCVILAVSPVALRRSICRDSVENLSRITGWDSWGAEWACPT